MKNEHVLSGLIAKRAELAGDLIVAQKRLETLRDDLDAVDRILRVFDPNQGPEKIRPIVKRRGDRMFGYGECARAVLDALRFAPEPITVDQVVERGRAELSNCHRSPGASGDAIVARQGGADETE